MSGEEVAGISPEAQRSDNDEDESDFVEPKGKPKMIRVLTVIAYALSVSMAAILLSVYYVFMWEGHPTLAREGPGTDPQRMEDVGTPKMYTALSQTNDSLSNQSEYAKYLEVDKNFILSAEHEDKKNTENVLVGVPYEPTAIPVVEATTVQTTESSVDKFEDQDPTWPDYPGNFSIKLNTESLLIKKLMLKNTLD